VSAGPGSTTDAGLERRRGSGPSRATGAAGSPPRAKWQVNTFGFGTDNEMEQADSLVMFKQSTFPARAHVNLRGTGEPASESG
jgi:hypothetical protein